jgi:hypothetical protein
MHMSREAVLTEFVFIQMQLKSKSGYGLIFVQLCCSVMKRFRYCVTNIFMTLF